MLKISIVGTRGIPASYGGFETFAEELSQLLVLSGYEVFVECDRCDDRVLVWKGVNLFYAPVKKSQNPLRYYLYGLKYALHNSEIIIVTGAGGAIFYFLNLFSRKTIITNTDGIESKRTKWSLFQRAFLKFSEMLSLLLSDFVIADSNSIFNYLKDEYKIGKDKIRVIEYGSYINDQFDSGFLLESRLKFREYYLVVCRIEPENNLQMIIDGYTSSGSEYPLVIVGQVTENRFAVELAGKFNSDKVFFFGGVYNRSELNSLRFGCKAYIHGHSVGGTNPSLLEAMGNGNIVICHDNIFNREVTEDRHLYFSDSTGCAGCIQKVENMKDAEVESIRVASINRIREYYNWNNILQKYKELFASITKI